MSSALLSVILVCNRRILSGPDFKSWSQIGGAAQMCSDLCPNINYQYASQVATVAGQLEIGLSDVAGNSAKCYIHFDRSACQALTLVAVCPTLKKLIKASHYAKTSTVFIMCKRFLLIFIMTQFVSNWQYSYPSTFWQKPKI
jgi:hypothetical protein